VSVTGAVVAVAESVELAEAAEFVEAAVSEAPPVGALATGAGSEGVVAGGGDDAAGAVVAAFVAGAAVVGAAAGWLTTAAAGAGAGAAAATVSVVGVATVEVAFAAWAGTSVEAEGCEGPDDVGRACEMSVMREVFHLGDTPKLGRRPDLV
jgi:hypothetical protein